MRDRSQDQVPEATINNINNIADKGISVKIDPWTSFIAKDYKKYFEIFGMEPIDENLLTRLNNLLKRKDMAGYSYLFRRRIIFGHRDLDVFLDYLEKGRRVALVTGFMPSGPFHFGHKLVVDQIVLYQRLGVKPFILMADIEAHTVRKLSFDTINNYIKEYIITMTALGVDPDNTVFYRQSDYDPEYYSFALKIAAKTTMNEMRSIYGDLSPGKIVSILLQVSDILHPMLERFGKFEHVIVPVGPDQDPHIKFSRDIAERLGLTKPAATYHRFMTGLDGGKMSSSRPQSYIALNEDLNIMINKLMRAFTGGRASIEEQKKYGGEPERCSIYEFYAYHLIQNNNELKDIYNRCRKGDLLCGECKVNAKMLLIEYISKYHQWRKHAIEKARKILKRWDIEV